MKHLFVVNPVAGGSDRSAEIYESAKKAFENREDTFEMYITNAPLDAMHVVRKYGETGEELRVYACGGDGTFNECCGGAAHLKNVAVAPFATGTGNDFIKTFGDDRKYFFQLENLLNGTVQPIDLIDVNGRICVDIASVGIDARIGTDVHKYSKIPLIGGATGYITSLVVNVIKGLGQQMKIEAGDVKAEGKYAMVTCCNGNFYGGGFNPIKDANPADGQMNVLLTKNISRLQAAGLIGKYGDGKYYEVPETITRVDVNKVHIKLDRESVINIDGEAIYADDVTMELIPGALQFIVPEGMTYFDKKPE